ncbi:MAG: hypothetical protein BAJALOKI3v1_1010010 [Promethearchaeota archaeon]|nr:MAG: hypothetical protein BAJALOKI3v1_1010010 [Candidatus Lokiarchaeota archaeon]
MPNNNKDSRQSKIVVDIKKEAFRNIIAHIFRFGHEALDESVDTMGFCLGSLEQDHYVVKNAIPVSHGPSLRKNYFSKKSKLVNQIEEKYQDENLQLIGWYISHPSEGVEWKEIDIQNHLQIQTERRPNAFCILLDHKLIRKEDDFGVKIYTLKDFEMGEASEIKELAYKVESPNSLDFFNWVQKFVEDYHKSDPILIKEIEEIVEPKAEMLQEIPSEMEGIQESEINFGPHFQNSLEEFGEMIDTVFKTEINTSMNGFVQEVLRGSKKLENSTKQMRDNITLGMQRLGKWFETQIEEISRTFKNSVKNSTETRVNQVLTLEELIREKSDDVSLHLQQIIEDDLQTQQREIKGKLEQMGTKLKELISINSTNLENQQKVKDITQKLNKSIQELSSKLIEDLNPLIKDLIEQQTQNLEDLKQRNELIDQKYSIIEESIKKLEKAILSLRNI